MKLDDLEIYKLAMDLGEVNIAEGKYQHHALYQRPSH